MKKDIEMQEHLTQILRKYSLRKDLINRLLIDPISKVFHHNIDTEDKWDYYNNICKELKIDNKIIRSHGMDSDKASHKKKYGHEGESFFLKYGLEVNNNTNKSDLNKNGMPYASVKSGYKIQWGMHTINNLPKEHRDFFYPWYVTFENKSLSLEDRINSANDIILSLKDKNKLYNLINYFLRKEENVPYLIIKDLKKNFYYEVDYNELINVMVDNLEFYCTDTKVKIVGTIKLNKINRTRKNNNFVLFEFEPRTDKNNCILMHGTSDVIISIIEDYNIKINNIYDVEEEIKQNTDTLCRG